MLFTTMVIILIEINMCKLWSCFIRFGGVTYNGWWRGQLYCRHANATALFSSPVVSALGSKSDDLGPSPGQGKALCPWDMRGKKMQAPLLGLAKSRY